MSALSSQEFSYRFRHDNFQGGMVESLMFGVYTSLVLFTLHKIVSQRGIKTLCQALPLLMVLMYALAIVHFARLWRHLVRGFVDHASSEQSTFEVLGTLSKANMVVSTLSRGLMMLIGDCVIIWRCWMLYGKSWAVIAVPMLLLIAELAFLITWVIYKSAIPFITQTGSQLINRLTMAYMSLTLATTVLTTALIIHQIVRMGGFKRNRDIIAIVIESSALYACALIVYMPFPIHPTLLDVIPNAVLVFMPGIASTLIIARVSLGHGIEKTFDGKEDHVEQASTSDRHHVSTLRFHTTTTGTRNGDTETRMDMTGNNTSETQSANVDLDQVLDDGSEQNEKHHKFTV